VLNSGVIAKTGIMATMSALAADGFVDFLKWLAEQKRRAPQNSNGSTNLLLSVNPLRFPTFQNVIVLPKEYRTQISQDIGDFLSQEDIKKYFLPIEMDYIERFAKYLDSVEHPHRESKIEHNNSTFDDLHNETNIGDLQRDFKSFFTQYDRRRGQNFTQTFPGLADWYNSIE
jgi:hypothetical protein